MTTPADAGIQAAKEDARKAKDKKVEALDGFDIYETPEGRFYAVVLFSGMKSAEFDTILSLTNYYDI